MNAYKNTDIIQKVGDGAKEDEIYEKMQKPRNRKKKKKSI